MDNVCKYLLFLNISYNIQYNFFSIFNYICNKYFNSHRIFHIFLCDNIIAIVIIKNISLTILNLNGVITLQVNKTVAQKVNVKKILKMRSYCFYIMSTTEQNFRLFNNILSFLLPLSPPPLLTHAQVGPFNKDVF